MPAQEVAIVGCLLGTAVGDAIGLPCEHLSPQRQQKLFPGLDGHHFLFGRGMTSDDTEHTAMVAQSLIASAGEPEVFASDLAWRMRFWLLGLPIVIGLATLRGLLKLWMGYGPESSGVFSAGNGPAMRSALIGVCYGGDMERMRRLVRISTRLTHTDPKAEYGALAVALAARLASMTQTVSAQQYLQALQDLLGEEGCEMVELARRATAEHKKSTEQFAADMGLNRGVSGYVYHTVPVALHAWFAHQSDFREAVLAAVRCGGDTDTVAAIVGGIAGAGVGPEGIPAEWRHGLWEWPRSAEWLTALADRLDQVVTEGQRRPALPLSVWGLPLRNLLFLLVIMAHAVRRTLPPY